MLPLANTGMLTLCLQNHRIVALYHMATSSITTEHWSHSLDRLDMLPAGQSRVWPLLGPGATMHCQKLWVNKLLQIRGQKVW